MDSPPLLLVLYEKPAAITKLAIACGITGGAAGGVALGAVLLGTGRGVQCPRGERGERHRSRRAGSRSAVENGKGLLRL